MEKCFPRDHVLHKVVNPHVVKLAYCTMPNMDAKIQSQNSKIESKNLPEDEEQKCNCSKTKKGVPYECKWGGKCKTKGNVYKCDGLDEMGVSKWNYIGLSEPGMKERIGNHLQSFRQDRPERENERTLSEKIWEERRKGLPMKELKLQRLTRA